MSSGAGLANRGRRELPPLASTHRSTEGAVPAPIATHETGSTVDKAKTVVNISFALFYCVTCVNVIEV